MDRVTFAVNGQKCSVGREVSSDVTLLDYLRKTLELRGTKYMCLEGGCGACIVKAVKHPGGPACAVNTCMVSVTSCQDWDITTIEKIGNRKDGYHSVQTTLAEHNGTQCGFCTPGFVMMMYSLLQSRGSNMTMLEIESLVNNTCRCTGYRSILDAFKTFAKDAPKQQLVDIEDIQSICQKTGKMCKGDSCDSFDWCIVKDSVKEIKKEIQLKDNKFWYRVDSVSDVFDILKRHEGKDYMLVSGNTARGAFPILENPDLLIDMTAIEELKQYSLDQNLTIGSGVTLNECIQIFDKFSKEEYFGYLSTFYDHISLVASTSLRDLATIGGNLMVKYEHNEFPSDPFVLFESIGASLTILDASGSRVHLKPSEFLKIDMKNKLILNVQLPPLSDEYKYTSFKIMPRSKLVHARVNAGFLYKLGRDNDTVSAATIVFGGISSTFIHAEKTESYLIGKRLFSNETLQASLKILNDEIIVKGYPEEQAQAKKILARAIYYKGLLTLCPTEKVATKYRSGITNYTKSRPVSNGKQVYDTNPAIWPLSKPIPKIEALIQCSGEAPYSDDIPSMPDEVFAHFVLATVPTGYIDNIDASEALKLKGVVAFFTAKDIPGKNSFISPNYFFNLFDEEVLCDGKVKFHSQPVGIIVAESDHLAEKASRLIKITYKNVKKPVLTIKEAKTELGRFLPILILPPTDRGIDVKKIIKGKNEIKTQYHYHMEKQTCITRPTDDGIEINSSTQWIDAVQTAVANALKIPENTINIQVRRVGGGFGAKISRASQIAVACSLVTHKLNRPCRMVLPLTTNIKSLGRRLPTRAEFEIGVNSVGEIQYMEYTLFFDNGYMINEPLFYFTMPVLRNNYERSRWNFRAFDVLTDTAKNSWTRAPGTLEMIAMIEYMMEQISYELSLDPVKVRLLNMPDTQEDKIAKEVINTLLKNAKYDKRVAEIKTFNKENRWKKRGLRFSCIKWPVPILTNYTTSLSVHHGDGSVVITHGGVEIGQGINTKVVQIAAYCLNIPMDKIRIKATNNISNPNSMVTGASFTSESICLGALKCCQLLLDRLEPIRADAGGTEWENLIKTAFEKGINLYTSYTMNSNDQKHYTVTGAVLTEAEVDILTGEIQVRRVDLIEDVGQSISPEIDIGQIEGAFIFGLGYWTCEEMFYDANSGEVTTSRAFDYHVPLAQDIPIDFRINLQRNSYNKYGVLGSKATGEPATCLSICVAFAIRAAVAASRVDSGIPTTEWFHIEGPYTIDKILLAANVALKEFKFN